MSETGEERNGEVPPAGGIMEHPSSTSIESQTNEESQETSASPEDITSSLEGVEEKPSPEAAIRRLKDDLASEKKKNHELVNMMKYLQADIVNLQKQTDKMLIDVRNQARFGLVMELISVKEDLERAIGTLDSSTEASLIEGLKMLQSKIDSTLRNEDVSSIRVELGAKLDPRMHEAISFDLVEDSREDGTILSVIRKGYTIAGKVVKPALVEVARRAPNTNSNIEGGSETDLGVGATDSRVSENHT